MPEAPQSFASHGSVRFGSVIYFAVSVRTVRFGYVFSVVAVPVRAVPVHSVPVRFMAFMIKGSGIVGIVGLVLIFVQ